MINPVDGMVDKRNHILPVIVLSQFLCTSLWFAGNAVIGDIATDVHHGAHFLAHLTSSIQFGFICGTLVFAVLMIPDRFAPSRVFFLSALLAGIFNLGITIGGLQDEAVLFFRFMTGFFLAGIYPVGMKIASDYYQEGLGKSLGFLVGALVIGTAFPHLLKDRISGMPWPYVIYGTTLLSFIGGLCILLFVPDGPHRIAGRRIDMRVFLKGFRQKEFRAVSFGYFGHMWELYTFWAFVPVMLAAYAARYPAAHLDIPLLSFLIIASGGPACVLSGIIAQHAGVRSIATLALSLSCICCLVSPLFLFSASMAVFIFFLFAWSVFVIADSPLFSTLVARNAPGASRGSSLTMVNCIGFSITIFSIQLMGSLSDRIDGQYIYLLLAPGPLLGIFTLMKTRNTKPISPSI